MLGSGLLQGLAVTAKNIAGSFHDPARLTTVEYPEVPTKLPENYRMLVVAHYLRGVQYEALAEALNLPLGTVKTHLYRAKRRLRELLEQ